MKAQNQIALALLSLFLSAAANAGCQVTTNPEITKHIKSVDNGSNPNWTRECYLSKGRVRTTSNGCNFCVDEKLNADSERYEERERQGRYADSKKAEERRATPGKIMDAVGKTIYFGRGR